MSNTLSNEEYGLKLYNRFPPKYREDDIGENFALKRYLESLADGGFKFVIDDINGITNLIDPDNIDAKLLPILFEQYGLEIFNGIPENYLRYLLPKLGEAWSMKGSLSVIEFITSSLSGIKTTTEVVYDEEDNPLIEIRLEMDFNIGDYFPETEQFNKIIKNFLPFYCDAVLIYSYMFYENGIISVKEDTDTHITDVKDEVGEIRRFKGSSVFGEIIIGSTPIGFHTDYMDSFEDHITEIPKEVCTLAPPVDSHTNNSNNLLNSSFYTNGSHCFDIITVNGEKTTILY